MKILRLSWTLVALALVACSDLGDPLRREPRCEVSTASLDFGMVAVNDSATRSLTLRNAGNGPLTGAVSIACSAFRIVAGGGAFTLAPDEARVVTVRFAPAAPGVFSCALALGASCPEVPMLGVCLDPGPGALCQVEPLALDFGTITAGTSSDRTFAIHSVGSANLTVDVQSPCGEFLIAGGGGPATLPPGNSLVVTVRFNPLSSGSFSCAIAVGPGCPDVNVSGAGAPATTVSFAADVQPIFNLYCVGCHGGSGGLFLTSGASYGNLVNVPSSGYAPALRVKPSDLASSVLYGKITNSGQYGGSMPPSGSITPAEKNKIGTWIQEGAPNN